MLGSFGPRKIIRIVDFTEILGRSMNILDADLLTAWWLDQSLFQPPVPPGLAVRATLYGNFSRALASVIHFGRIQLLHYYEHRPTGTQFHLLHWFSACLLIGHESPRNSHWKLHYPVTASTVGYSLGSHAQGQS